MSESSITQKLYEVIDKLQHGVVSYTKEGIEELDVVVNGTVDASSTDNHTLPISPNNTDLSPSTCEVSDIEKYSPLLFNEESIRHNVNDWLLEHGQV